MRLQRHILPMPRLTATLVVALGVGATALATPGSASAASTGSKARSLPVLKIAFPADNVFTMETYIGVAKGFFKRQGVHVEITDGLGSNAITDVVAGQYDLTVNGTSAPLLTALEGKSTTVIRAALGGGNGGSLLVNPKAFTSLSALQHAQSCTIATFPPGTSAYGFAVQLKSSLHLKCTLQLLQTAPLQLAAIQSGSADVIVGSEPNFTTAVSSGLLKVLINTGVTKQRVKYLGSPYIESTMWGLTANLRAKRRSIVAFLSGLAASDKYLSGLTNRQIALILHPFPAFSPSTLAALVGQVAYTRPQLPLGSETVGTQIGFITRAEWTRTLNGLKTWAIPNYSASNPVFSYKQRVDMSFWDAATVKPHGS
jgi:ABC-type nitrate/sulfonate/bicarbonate transport system substrate-binding protein